MIKRSHLLGYILLPKRTIFIGFIVSASLLAGALAFQYIGGYQPCALCLDQREIHWTALSLIVLLIGTWAATHSPRVLGAGLAIITLTFLFSTVLALYHTGVEWNWWRGPATCASGAIEAINTPSDIFAPATSHGPSCGVAPWRFLGISMAGYNFLVSLALTGLFGLSFYRHATHLRLKAFENWTLTP